MDRVTFAVGNDQNLAGPRDHVNGHPAEDLLLGLRHEGVARAYDFVHPGNAFRAIGQGGNGLSPAHLENPIHPGDGGRRQNGRVHLPVPAGGRNHHQLGTAGNFRGDGVHEHRGRVGRRAAGNIDPHLFNGGDFLTQDDAGFVGDDEGISHLAAVERADIFCRLPEDVQKFRLHLRNRRLNFFRGHFQAGKLCFIEFGAVGLHRRIAVFFYVRDDIGHDSRHVRFRGNPGENFGIGHLPYLQNRNHLFFTCSSSLSRMALISPSLN